jgi:hypothetical protein
MLYLQQYITLGFEVFNAVTINIPTFWNLEASSLLDT